MSSMEFLKKMTEEKNVCINENKKKRKPTNQFSIAKLIIIGLNYKKTNGFEWIRDGGSREG